MAKTLTVQPITRITGQAKAIINLDDNGSVADARLAMLSLRGFEQFCLGRPAEEIPRIVNRICGVSSWDHHLAANKAIDKIFEVSPPPTGDKLRRLMQHLAWIANKALHLYFLIAPDYMVEAGSEPEARNFFTILKTNSELGIKVVKMRQLAAMLVEHFGGKAIHPTAVVPGGFSKPMNESEREELLRGAEDLLDFAKFSIELAKKEMFLKHLDLIKTLGVIKTAFIGTLKDDGSWEIYDGKLHLMKADGDCESFICEEYSNYIAEYIEPWSYAKFPYIKKWGSFSLLPDTPSIYRSGPLARINICEQMPTPSANAELSEFRERFGRLSQYSLLYPYASLIEMLANAEEAVNLLKDSQITDENVRGKVEIKAGHAIGCIESINGTLIHDYEVDKDGFITKANIILGNTHNMAPINLSLKQAAQTLIKDGKYDRELLDRLEMVIRAYNP
jgi:F420-non-reducing hydrogenase large subunit